MSRSRIVGPGGLTLVELLAVVAIIGLLVGLLLPAVQMARESSRRTLCASNLRQIGAATHQFVSFKNQRLPPGQVYDYIPNTTPLVEFRYASTLMMLLPFLDSQRLYDAYDMSEETLYSGTTPVFSARDNGRKTIPGTSTAVRQIRMAGFVCPSDTIWNPNHFWEYRPPFSIAPYNYNASAGPDVWNPWFDSSCTSVHGLLPLVTAKPTSANSYSRKTGSVWSPGPFGRPRMQRAIRDTFCPVAAISDGLSNTLAFGESRPDCFASMRLGWGSVQNGCGAAVTTLPLNYDTCQPPLPGAPPCNTPATIFARGFGSRHPGGVSFVLCDGAVRFVSELIDYETLQKLGAKADGEILPSY